MIIIIITIIIILFSLNARPYQNQIDLMRSKNSKFKSKLLYKILNSCTSILHRTRDGNGKNEIRQRNRSRQVK